jgi:hypothetical protein
MGPEQTREVLRRAAEIDLEHAAAAGPALRRAGEVTVSLSDHDVERIAVESGLSREAVRRALAEQRGGRPARREGRLRRWAMGEPAEVSRTFDAPADAVEANLVNTLHAKGLERARRGKHGTRWEPKRGLRHAVGRAMDRAGPGELIRSPIESDVWAAPGGQTRATLSSAADNLFATFAVIAAVVLAFPAGIALLVVIALGLRYGFTAQHALGVLLIGAAWAAASVLAGRTIARRKARKLRRSLERALDEVAAPRGALH